MLSTHAKFWNSVHWPATKLFESLSKHPYALQPDSNSLMHQFEGLVLHTNHFAEKNGLKIEFSDEFKDLANSIKHEREKYIDQLVRTRATTIFEFREQKFRFIRNTFLAKYVVSKKEFDAVLCVQETIKSYFALLDDNLKITIKESDYGFHDWAFSYHAGDMSAYTDSAGLKIVKKSENGDYLAYEPELVRFIILDESAIGLDPKSFFPDPSQQIKPS